ncbi:hypothetical protein SDC9_179137 [bioreactor metagenome]|uniref:Uncharacterized protein n=1 Tax=bioreactor metagenome TaxID=1076179 RepID=A0A645H774_9ZZZZ
MEYIIDTNVPLKAADTTNDDGLDIMCALACLQLIKKVM